MDGEQRDDLGFRPHAMALARLIAARATAPPLAVALLAEWGGGKSAFLRLLGDSVESLVASGDDPQLVDRLTVVRFNAWHRNDTSVLVGIADRVAAAFRERDGDARASRRHGERRRARRRAAAVGWIERLDDREGWLERGADNPAVGPLTALWRRLRLVAMVPWALVQGGWRSATVLVLMLVLAVLLVVGPIVLPVVAPDLSGWVLSAGSWVNGALASSGVAALAAALIAVYRLRIAGARDDEQAPRTLAQLIAATIDQERDKAEARLDQIDAEDATRGLADLLHDGDRRARLDSARGFVRHLGGELGTFAEQLAQAEDHWRRARRDGSWTGTDRIVLLVDDLDRCTPDRVVEVLHALALLKSTSLFVVVVAADPRRLRRAVEQAGSGTGTEGSHLEGYVDDVADYLDAAFQVPFVVPRVIRSDGGRYLLATVAAQGLLAAPAGLSDAGSPRPEEPGPGHRYTFGALEQVEARILAVVSGALTTPRAVKKFLVLYRLVRLGTHLPAHVRFTEADGGHRQAAVLLALLVGAPAPAVRVLQELAEAADGALFTDVVGSLADQHSSAGHEPCEECLAWRRLRTVVTQAVEAGAPAGAGSYQRWTEEVARFSFRAEHLA